MRIALVLAVLAMASAPAFAEERSRFSGGALLNQPNVPCSCRYRGKDFHLGETICIRARLARCEMTLNNTSWKFTGRGCPVSMAPAGQSNGPSAG